MENDFFSCCFTGYRPQKLPFSVSNDDPLYVEFENRLIEKLITLVNSGCTTFISGMAAGFDIIAAQCVTEIRELITHTSVTLIGAVPFIGQPESYDTFWREKYDDLLEKCDKVVYLSDNYYKGCYMKRNIYMVDRSDMVLTFYDGRPGGTKNTVTYAKKKNRLVINLYDGG